MRRSALTSARQLWICKGCRRDRLYYHVLWRTNKKSPGRIQWQAKRRTADSPLQYRQGWRCIFLFENVYNQAQPLTRSLFPKFKTKFEWSDAIWYQKKPLGVNRLCKIMKEISLGAGLSKTYTNHCVRATAITLWSDSSVPARHIMSISGHANEQSLVSYNSRPSTSQLKNCSEILSHALEKGQAPSQTDLPSTTSCYSATSTRLVCTLAPNDSIFNSCNIGQAQVFILPQNGSHPWTVFTLASKEHISSWQCFFQTLTEL